MIVSIFSVLNKGGKERFFEESFLLADVKPEIVLEMSFLTISNANVDFQARNLQWRSYITRDIFPTTRRVELIGKKEFAAAALDLKHEVFAVHVAALSVNPDDGVHPSKIAEIANLKVDEAPTKVPSKCADFADVFSPTLAAKLPKHTGINDYAIEFVND